MKSSVYWKKRGVLDMAERVNQAADFNDKVIKPIYKRAAGEINERINEMYQKFANQENITLAEAKRAISQADFKGIDFESLVKEASLTGDEKTNKIVRTLAAKGNISRLELLDLQIQSTLAKAQNAEQTNVYDMLYDAYEDGYYKSLFTAQSVMGFGVSFAAADGAEIYKAITQGWKGDNYSERIWGHYTKLGEELRGVIGVGLIQGKSIDKMTADVVKRVNVARSSAERLVRTEANYIHNQATADAYDEYIDNEKYQYLATLDYRTSEICQSLDLKVFLNDDKDVGTNYPPMHPNCRSTTIPYFDGDKPGLRKARGADGKTYEVPGDMTYEQWLKSLSEDERGQLAIARKEHFNKSGDKEQLARYKEILGKDAPKSLAKFQEMKHTKEDEYKELKSLYKDVKWQKDAQENLTPFYEHKVPTEHDAKSVIDVYKDGIITSRRYFGNNGKAIFDIDLTDHGNPKKHPIVPHVQEIKWPKGKFTRDRTSRELTKAEEIANESILKKK